MKELHMPYDIDSLTKIRHECFHHRMENPGSKQQISNSVFKPPEPLRNGRNGRNGKVKMQRTQISYSKPVRTRASAIRGRKTKTSATITHETTFVELQRPQLIQLPQNNYQFTSLSSGSTLSSPEMFIESSIETPNYQTIGEPITMTTTTASETDLVYQVDCLDLNESIPYYVITSNDPITVEVAELVPESQLAVQNDDNELSDVSYLFVRFLYVVTNNSALFFRYLLQNFYVFSQYRNIAQLTNNY